MCLDFLYKKENTIISEIPYKINSESEGQITYSLVNEEEKGGIYNCIIKYCSFCIQISICAGNCILTTKSM
jgi:hypothetical protein